MQTQTRKSPSVGFTLVELLAVIAIIALLLSLLVPSLVSVKGLSHHPKCRENMRQMGNAVHAYASANYQMMPGDGITLLPGVEDYDWSTNPATLVARHGWSPGWWYRRWSDFIQPYLDTEAKPPMLGSDYVGKQPSDGIYDRWTNKAVSWAQPIIYSRRMNCPAFPNSDHWEYMHTGAFNYEGGGQWWRGPSREEFVPTRRTVTPDVPGPPPSWMGSRFQGHRISDFRVERYAAILEPDNLRWPGIGTINIRADQEFNDIGTLDPGYWGFLRYTYSVPHVNKTTNAMFLDGHVETFTQQYLRDWYANNKAGGLYALPFANAP